jgi:hypothetical protein
MRLRWLRAVLFSLAAVPLFAADPTVSSLVRLYERPELGAPKIVSGVVFTSGHMRITMKNGVAAPLTAGGEPAGFFFRGAGEYEYVSADPVEAAVLSTNAKKATKLRPETSAAGVVVRDTFEQLLVRAAGRNLPEFSAGEQGADLRAAYEAHLTELDREAAATVFDFVKQKVDASQRELVRAEIRGHETAVYRFDPVHSRRETLHVLQNVPLIEHRELRKLLWPVPLSSQPIGVSRKDFQEPPYILVNLDYTLTSAQKHHGQLHVVETLVPRGGAQRVFRFNLASKVYDSNGEPRFFNLRSVTAGGKPLSFHHEHDELLVVLEAAAPPDKPFELTFEIDGDFLIHPSGDSYWQLGEEAWFPQPALNGQYYRVHSTIKVKKPFVPFGPGRTMSRREEGDFNVVENRLDKPVQFLVAHAGRYSYEEETRNGLTVRVATYAVRNERAMKQVAALAFSIIAFYEKFLGPFPFEELNIIELNDFGYGQAPPATMFITREAFNPTLGWTNRLYSRGVNHLFAHEIAHQWWGSVVKMSTEEEQWVSEAFAEYCASLLMRNAKNSEGTTTGSWSANAREASPSSSIATANQLQDYGDMENAFWMRTYLIYSKGPQILLRLHEELGDKQFLTFLRTVQGKFAWRFVSTKDLIGVLKEVTGRDYTRYFDEHYWGTALVK